MPAVIIGTPGKAIDLDDKRFRMPGWKIVDHCPKCEKKRTYDLGKDDYLAYPVANKPFKYTLYCHDCDHEWPIMLKLNVTLELVSAGEAK